MIEKHFIEELKQAILTSRYNAAQLVNHELIVLYLKIGSKISIQTKKQAWGSKVIEQISNELQKELPGLKGFSGTNLKRMSLFFNFWKDSNVIRPTLSGQLYDVENVKFNGLYTGPDNEGPEFGPTLSNQLKDPFFSISFSNHFLIAANSKSIEEAIFYIQKSSAEYWSYRALEYHLKSDLYSKEGKLPNNFAKTLPEKAGNKAILAFKDEYLLDFINIEEPDNEDEKLIENEIVRNIKKFILTLGSGFAFIGNQYRLMVEEQEFFVDLLFFNRKLQSLRAIDLKRGKFKPEYLGKMNFYLSALDDLVKQPHENPSIGIILCKEKNNKIVEYSFRDFNKAMGVATYKTSNKIPEQFKGLLPDSDTLKTIMD